MQKSIKFFQNTRFFFLLRWLRGSTCTSRKRIARKELNVGLEMVFELSEEKKNKTFGLSYILIFTIAGEKMNN